MTLVVEDGTGLETAESFGSVASADAYHAARGNSTWAAFATADKEAALRNGAEFLAIEYQGRWKGDPINAVQALPWPREEAEVGATGEFYDDEVVPLALVRANFELALQASFESLWRNVNPVEVVVEESKELGPLKKSTKYRTPAEGSSLRVTRDKVDRLVQDLLEDVTAASLGTVRLVRA